MSFWRNLGRAFNAKASAAARAIVAYNVGQPVWTPRDYARIAEQSFMRNAIVFACVRKKAEALSSIPIELYQRTRRAGANESELVEHPILTALAAPNPLMSYEELVASWSSYLDLAGNSYLEALTRLGTLDVIELYSHRPDRMTITPDAQGWPRTYTYKNGGFERPFDMTPDPQKIRPIWHAREFHPLNDWYGMGAAEAALASIDIANSQKAYSKALLDNSARPSGAFVFEGDKEGGSVLSQPQRDELRKEIEERMTGVENIGRPLILGGGLKWQSMGINLKDLEFNDASAAEARTIALAFGVPPLLLGIPGDNTFANYEEANRAFWRETILPRARRWTGGLTAWLATPRNEGLRLAYDEDAIPALSKERRDLFEMLENATFLTAEEKREAAGFEAEPKVGTLFVPANMVPIDAAIVAPDMSETDPNADASAPLN